MKTNMQPKIYKSLLTGKRTTIHFDNGGKYGRNYLECQIRFERGAFYAYVTNGFKLLNVGKPFPGLKLAIDWGKLMIEVGGSEPGTFMAEAVAV